MGAPVKVDASAFDDPRFGLLARKVGLADRDHARGKMERVWSHCTQAETYFLSDEVIDEVAGVPGIARAAVEVGLAEETSKGIRVRGTRGRIEWKKKLRENAKKGGGQTRAKWKAKREADRGANQGPPSPSPSPSPSEDQASKVPEAARALALKLSELIAQRDPKYRELLPGKRDKTLESWGNTIRLIHERDGREYPEILRVIEWCQADSFWQANVLSAGKLREQFGTLVQQMARKRGATTLTSVDDDDTPTLFEDGRRTGS